MLIYPGIELLKLDLLERGNNFENVLHVQSMGIDTSASFHHYFHISSLFRYFQLIFTQSPLTVDSQVDK
jgi:hypothetical protein